MDSPHTIIKDTVASCTLFAVAQAALGAGVGLLIADRMNRTARNIAGITAISLGIASAAPFLVGMFSRQINSPRTARGMRNRLNSIREDSGIHSSAEFF